MNLRTEPKEPVKKKRGRPAETYTLTLKGFLSAYYIVNRPNIDPDKLYNELEQFAKMHTGKEELPCIVFDNSGGTFVGVSRGEN